MSFTLPVLSFFKISLSSSQEPLMIGTFLIPYGRRTMDPKEVGALTLRTHEYVTRSGQEPPQMYWGLRMLRWGDYPGFQVGPIESHRSP